MKSAPINGAISSG